MINEVNTGKKEYSLSSLIQRFACLIIPIASAFLGYAAAVFFNSKSNLDENCVEILKFSLSVFFFLISSTILFFKTRKGPSSKK